MMAGKGRFESIPADPEDLNFTGSFPNGQRLNYASANLDRLGSFREGGDNRMFNSGANIGRGGVISSGDFPTLPQVLLLDPITMGDQRFTRSGELRRALGITFGSLTEDNLFGAAHSKTSPPLATEELKRFRASVVDTSTKARGRAKKFDESLHNLNKYYEGLVIRKNQRKEMLANERCSGSNLMKMGSQTHRNPPDPLNQRPDDRAKIMVLNKRVRSSVTELRADVRNPSSMRQPSLTGKDNDLLRDGGEGSGFVEEKIRRLPAGGETWDKKMKRKRSVGAGFTRPMDGDGELRGATKLNNEPDLQSPDSHSFRSGSSNSTSGTNNIDGTPLHPSLNCRLVPKNESEKVSVLRDPTGSGSTKERLLVKGGIKLSVRDDNHVSPNPLAKGKGSRTPRGGPTTTGNSSPNFSRMSGAVDGWDQRPNLTKVLPVYGINNRKRTMPTASSSPPMAQWVGQRPQKMSRTRRANLISPVSNHDEVHMSSERCSPTDCGPRMASLATNGSIPSRALSNNNLVRLKNEKVSSPVRLSESEESGAVDNFDTSLKEKRSESGEIDGRALSTVSNVGCSLLLAKKKKLSNKEDISDFALRQGRSGSRGSTLSNISSPKEKLEAPSTSKLIKTMKPSLDKNGSKSGRPLKKMSDRKAFTCLGHSSNGTIPDIAGESNDDREELLAAANIACNSSYNGCSSTFWRSMESYFSLVGPGDVSFLKQQLKAAEEKQQKFSQKSGHDKSFLGDGEHESNSISLKQSSARNNSFVVDQNGSEHMARNLQLTDRDLATCGREFNTERIIRFPTLYETVLAALIAEDEIEEQETDLGRNWPTQYDRDDFSGARSMSINGEHRNGVSIDFESNASLGIKSQTCATERIFCNGRANDTNFNNQLNGEFFLGDHVFAPLRNGSILELPENGLDESLNVPLNSSAIASFHCPWGEMSLDDKLLLELQSIGLCTETVPNLSEGEDDALNHAILDLEKKYHKQVGTVKFHLNKLTKVEDCKETERVNLEQKAVDELVQLSYRKLLATRGSIASKFGVQKESKPSALGFMKKALSRCRLHEETGKSCFGEPPLLDALLAEPRHRNKEETMGALGSLDARKLSHTQISNVEPGSFPSGADPHEHNDKGARGLGIPSDLDFAKTGPILNRGRKKEVLLDDVGGLVPSRALATPDSTLLAGTKGKRSERDRDKGMLNRNSVAKTGRLSVNVIKGERKTKSKPKQKTDQLSPSGNKLRSTFSEATQSQYLLADGSTELLANGNGSIRKRESNLMTDGNSKDFPKNLNDPLDMGSLPMNDFESMELSITNDLGGPQDIGSWLSFDDDGLQDHDSMGLDIPMDDLSDLNMLL